MIRLHGLFSDNMVMQRDMDVPVWGWDRPGQKVTVKMGKRTARAVAGRDGKFTARLPKMKAGGPFEMTVEGSSRVTLKNVMVGEVWVLSGQSNMQFRVREAKDAKKEIASAKHPNIRLFSPAIQATVKPVNEIEARWQVCSPATIPEFSAAGYYCGRELQKELKVAIGLINSSLGATRAETWCSREALLADANFRKEVRDYEKSLPSFPRRLKEYERIMAGGQDKYYPADPGNGGIKRGWAKPETDTSKWAEMKAPGYWTEQGLDFNGVLWFRKDIDVPEEWAGKDLTLGLGSLDKTDITYFNGVKVGAMGKENPNAWNTPREYKVPGRLVKAGRNVVAVRVYSWAFDGGFRGPWDRMKIAPTRNPKAKAIGLAGTWQYKVEHNFGKVKLWRELRPYGPGTTNSPYGLFNGMIHPIVPYAARGVIWHQGASNLAKAVLYRKLLALLIKDWRKQWGKKDMWFNVVQQENYGVREEKPADNAWAELRESQLVMLKIPRVSLAVTTDIGDANDVHPADKQALGRRIAIALLGTTYGKKIVYSGPIYKSCARVGKKMRLRFDHVGGGLVAKGGKLKGFAIAGANRKFVWAKAKIAGSAVVVWSDEVAKPVAVRYGWTTNPDGNLYNRAKLPASTFRTDKWPGISERKDGAKAGVDNLQVR